MREDKAAEILQDAYREFGYILDPDTSDAIQLGIEALKLLGTLRSLGYPRTIELLPGETKE